MFSVLPTVFLLLRNALDFLPSSYSTSLLVRLVLTLYLAPILHLSYSDVPLTFYHAPILHPSYSNVPLTLYLAPFPPIPKWSWLSSSLLFYVLPTPSCLWLSTSLLFYIPPNLKCHVSLPRSWSAFSTPYSEVPSAFYVHPTKNDLVQFGGSHFLAKPLLVSELLSRHLFNPLVYPYSNMDMDVTHSNPFFFQPSSSI